MKDFLGQELAVDDFVVYPGSGNGKAEYGLLLMKVKKVSADSIRVERLDCQYRPDAVNRVQTTIKALTKVIKILPPSRMLEVFDNPEGHFELVSKWIHGRTDINWNTLEVGKMRD